MDSSHDISTMKCFDGLHYSFEMLDYNYSRIYDLLANLKNDGSKVVAVLTHCWSFIDAVHRLREIGQAIPGLNKKSKELRLFLESTTIAEEARHYIQHLRQELLKKETVPYPVWGSLSWVDTNDSMLVHTALLGTRVANTNYSSAVFDTFARKWVSRVSLGINEKSFHFDPIYAQCRDFRKFIILWIESHYNATIKTTHSLSAFSFNVVIKERSIES